MQLDELVPERLEGEPANAAPWLRNCWYAVTWSANLPPGKLFARTILNEPLVIFRRPDGEVVALADYCPHLFAPLNIGTVLPDGRIRCGYHGLEFDASGRCVRNPHGNGKIPPGATVPSYPVREKSGMTWVWLGTAPPDEEQFPDYRMFEGVPAEFSSIQDYLMLAAPYTAVAENILDASHLSFVHDGILGNINMIDTNETTIERRGDQVEVTRSSRDVPVPPILEVIYRSGGRRADNWNSVRWEPPGAILICFGVTECGAERTSGTGYYAMHLLTPETETTTHYHFWAARWNVRDTDETVTREIQEYLNVARRRAFEEQDKPVIEAQQRVRARLGPGMRPALMEVDAAGVRARRILQARIAREAAAG